MAMKRLVQVVKREIIPVRDNFIWWKEHPKCEQILYEFKKADDIDKYTLHSDIPFGGRSQCSLSIIKDENDKSFGRFKGHIMLTPGIPGTVLGKKSFCAFRSPVYTPSQNWSDFVGIEMKVRTSNHPFVFNVHPDGMVPSDLYQGFIAIPHRDWAILQIKFDNLLYTGYGYQKFEQKPLDTKHIASFNIAIHQTKETDFCFDIEYIKGIHGIKPNGKRPQPIPGREALINHSEDWKAKAPPAL